MNTSSFPSNGCPYILIPTYTCCYWPSTVLLSYHVLCCVSHSSECCSSSLLSPPASLYAHLMLSGSQLPPSSTFDSKTDHAEQSTAGRLIKPPVTSVIVSRDMHLLGSVKEEGWEGGRLKWWGRSETVVPIQCLHTKDHWVWTLESELQADRRGRKQHKRNKFRNPEHKDRVY